MWFLVAQVIAGAGPPPSIEQYIRTLESEEPDNRRFAARSLRREVRTSLRLAGRQRQSLTVIEANQALMVFDDRLVPACIKGLDTDNIRGLCADILGLLEASEAEPALRGHLETGGRRIARALKRIQQ